MQPAPTSCSPPLARRVGITGLVVFVLPSAKATNRGIQPGDQPKVTTWAGRCRSESPGTPPRGPGFRAPAVSGVLPLGSPVGPTLRQPEGPRSDSPGPTLRQPERPHAQAAPGVTRARAPGGPLQGWSHFVPRLAKTTQCPTTSSTGRRSSTTPPSVRTAAGAGPARRPRAGQRVRAPPGGLAPDRRLTRLLRAVAPGDDQHRGGVLADPTGAAPA